MKLFPWILLIVTSLLGRVIAAEDYQTIKKEAEKWVSEGSFEKARELYQSIPTANLSSEQKRWVQFRLADTLARSQASSRQSDDSKLQQGTSQLNTFLETGAVHDRAWAEANESLADVRWYYPRQHDWSAAWPLYQQGLEYWAASTNLELARDRYLGIVRKMSEPVPDHNYYYGYWGNSIPMPVLENALKIATSGEDKAHFHYLVAMQLQSQGGSWEQRVRIPREFEAALELEKKTDWYDDALYYYALWMNSNGRAVQDQNGNWSFAPDYQRALELFRRLTNEFEEGESRWYNAAKGQIREITEPSIQVTVPNVFLPGSEIEFFTSWRNVNDLHFSLYRVDLTKAVNLQKTKDRFTSWLSSIDSSAAEKTKSWSKEVPAKVPHEPGNEHVTLPEKLEPGAYLLEASSGGKTARDIVLVSDLAIVSQSINQHTLVYVSDSASGAPIPESEVAIWQHVVDGSNSFWTKDSQKTDKDGIAVFDSAEKNHNYEFFVAAKAGQRQAFNSGSGGRRFSELEDQWKIYAFTDRPAYRPGETVHWKLTARRMTGEGHYIVPKGQEITLRVTDPRGAEIKKEELELNAFGSAWGDLELGSEKTLGEYRATFLDASGDKQIGSATLFRLEEYKLPEFKVSIHTPEKNGRKKTFLLGEKIEVEIEADYYFGGPVANATVEAVVNQQNFYHIFERTREFPWLYTDQSTRRYPNYGGGQVVLRETLKTDENGKAKLTIQSPFGGGADLQYRIEARVTDASRREITATENVRVSAQRFFVEAKPAHHLYQPRDKIELRFMARDINEQPVAAEGKVIVNRDFWFEIWIDPNGREVKGDELKKLQSAAIFPPRPNPAEKGWRLKFRGYSHDQILSRTLKTGTNGEAVLTFTPEREGYYRISWLTDEKLEPGKIPSRPIRAEASVWVATGHSKDLGYRPGGLEILADKDSFKVGQKAPVMLSIPDNDRYVLFTVTAGELLYYELVHLDGNVKLLELPIEESAVPNIFLNAAMIADQQTFMDSKEIVVPPTKNFLTMEMKPEREEYLPGQEGRFQIQVRDDEGKPVQTEIALSVVDESVFYIQSEYAADPRQFFFGDKHPRLLQTSSSFQNKQYRKVDHLEEELMREATDENKIEPAPARMERMYYRSRGMNNVPGLIQYEPLQDNRLGLTPAFYDKAEAAGMVKSAIPAASAMEAAPPENPVQVRSDFRTSIYWQPDIHTDVGGNAEIKVKYPDSLTGWKATARGVSIANQFGIVQTSTRTKKPLIVRLEAPRFFLAGDAVTVSAVINNNTGDQVTVRPELMVEGMEPPQASGDRSLTIPPNSEKRVDWTLHPREAGEARIKVVARGNGHSDGMEKSFTIYEHGIEKFLAVSGKSHEDEVLAKLTLPREVKEGSVRFSVQVTPSLAVTMLDALPYLANYPYGCTEQTMSRFLPSIITAKTLKDLGLDPAEIMSKSFGGIETNSASKTHPAGKHNLKKLEAMTTAGLQRLYDFQHGDGGWGWWKQGDSDPFMTAYVVWGLALAQQAQVEIKNSSARRAVDYLEKKLVEAEADYPLQAWMLHALSAEHALNKNRRLSKPEQKAFENLWKHREQLNAYSRALFALAAHQYGKSKEAATLVRNLENGVELGNSGASLLDSTLSRAGSETAHWGEDGFYWRWSEGGVEATAFALRALLQIDPKNKLVEPTVNWLIKNRRGAQWNNTRDTAIVVLALNDYLAVSGETKGRLGFELLVNGHSIAKREISGAEIFKAPSVFEVPREYIKNGENQIRIARKSGDAPIYFAGQASCFSLEEPVTSAGNELFVKRQYYRLAPIPTLLNGYTFKKQLLPAEGAVKSGDRIETVITIEAKNNYEYLLIEDLKPAGFEAVAVRSGDSLEARQIRSASLTSKQKPTLGEHIEEDDSGTGRTRSVYQELRDRKVALFLDKLPEGLWQIRYELRAETPGTFHALPALAHAMYVPEIQANSAETTVVVKESAETAATATDQE
jgi:uncharacterized protein YfaS (alpha-2-macroglobulin family)